MNVWKQLRAILLLPGMVIVAIPTVILCITDVNRLPSPSNIVLPIVGSLFVILGLILMAWTIRLFILIGKGTLAPFDPPQKLVVRGIYKHVRNPMIVGVICVLLGEAIFFGSLPLIGWFGIFCTVNMIYIPLMEEPGLAKRFGGDYLRYKENVPRWIPRLRPWEGLPSNEQFIRGDRRLP